MTGIAAPAARMRPAAARGDWLLPAVLWLAAAAISAFTLRRYLDPFDEGLLMAAVDRIAAGQWPYADFTWPYGPGHPLLLTLAADAFGPSVLWWRLVRVAADATVALLAFALVRRSADARWGTAAWLACAVTMAQPSLANPFPVALALALGAVLAAATGRPILAGVLAAMAAAWRLDFGVIACLAALAAAGPPTRRPAVSRGRDRWPPRARRAITALDRSPPRPRWRIVVAAVAGTVLVYAPFAVAAGPGELWRALAGGSLDDGRAWRLPFPLAYDGPLRAWPPGDFLHDAKDLIGYQLPLVAVLGLAAGLAAVALRAMRERRVDPIAAGLGVLALGGLAYLLSRADEFHQQPLAVAVAALLACTAAAARRPWARAALAAPIAFIVLAGTANRVSALVLPPDLRPVDLPGVPGIRVPPAEADALPRLVAEVQRLTAPGEPIYVAPRRSDLVTFNDPLVHYLTRRPNVLREDALLQARPEEQARIVATLRRERPVVVRWTDPLSSRPEPNERGRPSGSRLLDAVPGGGVPPGGALRELRRARSAVVACAPVLARVALLVVALAVAAWLAYAFTGARDEARARDLPTRPDGSLAPRDREQAIELLEGARRGRPDGTVVPQLAAHYLTRGDAERAVALLRPLVRAEPENVTAWTVLALALSGSDPAGARAAEARRRELAPPVPR